MYEYSQTQVPSTNTVAAYILNGQRYILYNKGMWVGDTIKVYHANADWSLGSLHSTSPWATGDFYCNVVNQAASGITDKLIIIGRLHDGGGQGFIATYDPVTDTWAKGQSSSFGWTTEIHYREADGYFYFTCGAYKNFIGRCTPANLTNSAAWQYISMPSYFSGVTPDTSIAILGNYLYLYRTGTTGIHRDVYKWDFGSNWTLLNSRDDDTSPPSGSTYHHAYIRASADTLYAGFLERTPSWQWQIKKSTDGGSTWVTIVTEATKSLNPSGIGYGEVQCAAIPIPGYALLVVNNVCGAGSNTIYDLSGNQLATGYTSGHADNGYCLMDEGTLVMPSQSTAQSPGAYPLCGDITTFQLYVNCEINLNEGSGFVALSSAFKSLENIGTWGVDIELSDFFNPDICPDGDNVNFDMVAQGDPPAWNTVNWEVGSGFLFPQFSLKTDYFMEAFDNAVGMDLALIDISDIIIWPYFYEPPDGDNLNFYMRAQGDPPDWDQLNWIWPLHQVLDMSAVSLDELLNEIGLVTDQNISVSVVELDSALLDPLVVIHVAPELGVLGMDMALADLGLVTDVNLSVSVVALEMDANDLAGLIAQGIYRGTKVNRASGAYGLGEMRQSYTLGRTDQSRELSRGQGQEAYSLGEVKRGT